MSYMPNTLRITQFCIGQHSLDGFREPRPDDVVVYVPGTYDLFRILTGFTTFETSLLISMTFVHSYTIHLLKYLDLLSVFTKWISKLHFNFYYCHYFQDIRK